MQNISIELLCVRHLHSLPVHESTMCGKPRVCRAQVFPARCITRRCLQLGAQAELITLVWVLYPDNVLAVANSEFFTDFMRTHHLPLKKRQYFVSYMPHRLQVELGTAPQPGCPAHPHPSGSGYLSWCRGASPKSSMANI